MIYYLTQIETFGKGGEKKGFQTQNPGEEDKPICKPANPSAEVRQEAAYDNGLLYVGQNLKMNVTTTLHRNELSSEVREYAMLFQPVKTRAGTNKAIIPL